MAVSREDVLHIAGLARLGVTPDRLDILAGELSGILTHMEALQQVRIQGGTTTVDGAHAGMPLRADEPPSVALERPREAFAPLMIAPDGGMMPAMLDGFYLVPRLATHEDTSEES